MASKTRNYNQKKLLGQIYTPLFIVEKILKDSGFYNLDFDNNSILDPACGDGRFLVPIAQFIIENSPSEQLKKRLENLHGWDIDPETINLCRRNLDELLLGLNININWNLLNINALEQIESSEKFDLIVGNPPYIRIQHLPVSQRQYIQTTYSFCRSGSTDAYVAFFELASALLKETGTCGFITPNSFFISETGKHLRSYFIQNQNLKQITNYGSVRIFGTTGTYAAITVFGKSHSEQLKYQLSDHELKYESRDIPFSELSHEDAWHLSVTKNLELEGISLGKLCRISVGITTLSDRLYLFSILDEKGNLVKCINKNGAVIWLEREILKPIIKGSKLKNSSDPITEYVLFPYKKDGSGKYKIILEEVLKADYPKANKYLKSIKTELGKRDNGKLNSVTWYAFGRAQGINSSFGKKIIFSPMNRSPNFILVDNPDCTVYSGYFIKYEGDYDFLLAQLNSQRMADFIAVAGRDFQGGYKGYNKKVVENFIITNSTNDVSH